MRVPSYATHGTAINRLLTAAPAMDAALEIPSLIDVGERARKSPGVHEWICTFRSTENRVSPSCRTLQACRGDSSMINRATSSSEYESECCLRNHVFVATTTSSIVGADSSCTITSRSTDVTNDGSTCRTLKCCSKSAGDNDGGRGGNRKS